MSDTVVGGLSGGFPTPGVGKPPVRLLPADSIVRRRASDPRIGGAAGYALALQVGHPTIAAGVRDHSNYAADAWGRFFRTADFVLLLAYGDGPTVAKLAADLRAQHAAIRGTDLDGTRYSALEPSAYAWVHATLGIAIVQAHDHMGTRFTAEERERFWQEWLVLGDALHVQRSQLPAAWLDVDAYVQRMIDDVLVDNDVVQDVQAAAVRVRGTAPVRWLPTRLWEVTSRPAGPVLRVLGSGMLPPELRERFGVRWTARDERLFRAWCRASRASGRVLPRSVRQSAPVAFRVRRREIGPFGVPNRGARLA
jgi:uncharacterized protein (DUF2236 family)